MVRPLTAEIYLLVFQHMSVLPFPHATDGDEPIERQRDLASCMRVCRMFNKLASFSLYRFPVVRSMESFVAGIEDPPVAGLIPKIQLYRRVERPFLEYSNCDRDADIISDEAVEEYMSRVKSTDRAECKREVRKEMEAESISTALRKLVDHPTPLPQLFPLIRTLSTNAIVGPYSYRPWLRNTIVSDKLAKQVQASQDALHEFLNALPTIRHFCQTGQPGPLSLSTSYLICSHQLSCTVSTHCSIENLAIAPACIGLRTRWYVHAYNETDPIEDVATHDVRQAIRSFMTSRLALAGGEHRAEIDSWGLTGGIYHGLPECEDSHPLSDEKIAICREDAARNEKSLRVLIGRKRGDLPDGIECKDDFEYKPLIDAPMCEACEWQSTDIGRPDGFYESIMEWKEMMYGDRARKPTKPAKLKFVAIP